MSRIRRSAQSRAALDARFSHLGSIGQFSPPIRGWIKAVREALGMSTAQLAKRLKISQSAVTQMETSEMNGTIELRTLRRIAAALDCTLVYALIPRKPLEETVRDRARQIVRKRQRSIEHTMELENQRAPSNELEARLEARIDDYLRSVDPKTLWDEP